MIELRPLSSGSRWRVAYIGTGGDSVEKVEGLERENPNN